VVFGVCFLLHMKRLRRIVYKLTLSFWGMKNEMNKDIEGKSIEQRRLRASLSCDVALVSCTNI
jgi:hypothetical protein